MCIIMRKDLFEYLTGEENLLPQNHRIIQEITFPNSPLGKALKKQIKTIEEHLEKLVEAINL